MEKPTSNKISAARLQRLFHEQHKDNASLDMMYRNTFALACWLQAEGQEAMAKVLFKNLFYSMNTHGHTPYIQDLRAQLPNAAAAYISEIVPNKEFRDLMGLRITRRD